MDEDLPYPESLLDAATIHLSADPPDLTRLPAHLPSHISQSEIIAVRRALLDCADWWYECKRHNFLDLSHFPISERLKLLTLNQDQPYVRMRYILKRIKMDVLLDIFRKSLRSSQRYVPDLSMCRDLWIGVDLFLHCFAEYVLEGKYWAFERRREEFLFLSSRRGGGQHIQAGEETENGDDDDDDDGVTGLKFGGVFLGSCFFPLDLLQHCLRFVRHDYDMILSIGLVSWRFYYAVLRSWNHVKIEGRFFYEVSAVVLASVSSIQIVDCEFVREKDFQYIFSAASARNLKALQIHVIRDHIWDRFRKSLQTYEGQQLEGLLQIDFGRHRHLGGSCQNESLSILAPNLEFVTGNVPRLELCQGCSKLRYLEIVDLHVTDEESMRGLRDCPLLREVFFDIQLRGKGFVASHKEMATRLQSGFSTLEIERIDLRLGRVSRRRSTSGPDLSISSTLNALHASGRLTWVREARFIHVPVDVLEFILAGEFLAQLHRLEIWIQSHCYSVRDQQPGSESWREDYHRFLFRGLLTWTMRDGSSFLLFDEAYADSENFFSVIVAKGTSFRLIMAVPRRSPMKRDYSVADRMIPRDPNRFSALTGFTFLTSIIQSGSLQSFCGRFSQIEVLLDSSTASDLMEWWLDQVALGASSLSVQPCEDIHLPLDDLTKTTERCRGDLKIPLRSRRDVCSEYGDRLSGVWKVWSLSV